MSDLLDKIATAQRDAGERVVMDDLRSKGLLDVVQATQSADERNGPPFTVDRYGSFGACVIAERDYYLAEGASWKAVAHDHSERLKVLAQERDAERLLRRQAEVERDIAVVSLAELAETLRVVRNTQGGRFGLDWPTVERMVNQVLNPPTLTHVGTASSLDEMYGRAPTRTKEP